MYMYRLRLKMMSASIVGCLMVSWALSVSARCQHARTLGSPEYQQSPDGYIRYQPGNAPIILLAPHGGNLKPESIPDRENGCDVNGECVYAHGCGLTTRNCKVTSVKDSYTKEISEMVAAEIHQLTGSYAHVIINELHRSKMDANRDLQQATLGVEQAVAAYNYFVAFIEQAKQTIEGPGIVFDIHGQTHPEEWTELGYRITKEALETGQYETGDSSIRSLVDRRCAGDVPCLRNLVKGNDSLGFYVTQAGYSVVPSPTHPDAAPSGHYYRGGYNTETYGSRHGGSIDAIQIEMPKSMRFGPREEYAKGLAGAIIQFLRHHNYI